jgi:RNA polymerase sigma-70 factor (ECF subfamily)
MGYSRSVMQTTDKTATPPSLLSTSLSLLARLHTHDDDAWRQFVTLYAPLVVRWCHRQGLSEADLADVAQEVFRKVMQALPRFRKETPDDSFRGWLCRITHHEIANFGRDRDPFVHAQGGSELLVRLHAVPDRLPAEPGDDEVRQETRFLYQNAVQLVRGEFSDRHWQMFWRMAVDGNPAAGVAEEFGTTPAAVRQAKARVLRRLKEVVGEVAD